VQCEFVGLEYYDNWKQKSVFGFSITAEDYDGIKQQGAFKMTDFHPMVQDDNE